MDMDLRRRMMSAVKPLFIFEFGKKALSNGVFQKKPAYLTDGINFSGGYLFLGHDYDRSNGTLVETRGYADIGGIDFSRYKKLHFECRAITTDYNSSYTNFLVGYGEKVGAAAEAYYTEFQNVPKTFGVLSFDISGISGEQFIKMLNNTSGNTDVQIKNIWLE